SIIAASLWIIGGACKLGRWFIPVVLAAPLVWQFARQPWDNTFGMPISCALLAAYAMWLAKPTRITAGLCGTLAIMLPLIHPVGIPLSAAVFAHAALSRRGDLRRALPFVLIGVLIGSASSARYIWTVSQVVMERVEL